MSSLSLLPPPNLYPLHIITTTSSSSSSPLFILHHRSSLYGNSSTTTTAPRAFVSWNYRTTDRSDFAPMRKSRDGYSRVCSFSKFRGDTGGDVEKGSGEIKAEADDDDESGIEVEKEGQQEIGHLSPTFVLPERWDVLGLGQAMETRNQLNQIAQFGNLGSGFVNNQQ